MKVIDEKGRLFGVINVIDFMVLLFLLCLTPMLYFGYKIFFVKNTKEVKLSGEVIIGIQLINCQFIKLEPNISKIISIGDKAIEDKGRVIGEIIELGAIEPYREDPTLKQRSARLELKVQLKGNDIYYKGEVIDDGSELVFKTDKYNAIIKVEEDITKILMVRITLKDLDEDAVNLIAVGDKEMDAAGRTLAEIVKIGKSEDDSFELNLTGGNFTIGKDTTKKQIATEMLLRCQIITNEGGANQIYFKGRKITYNTPIKFVTNKYDANGLISKIYESIPLEVVVKWVSLRVKFPGIILEVANVIKTGDVERDFYGSVTARIVNIISNEPARMTALQEGKLITFMLPSQRDLVIALGALCQVRDGTYYFKNNSVKMGNSVTFSTELYSITGMIIGMEVQ